MVLKIISLVNIIICNCENEGDAQIVSSFSFFVVVVVVVNIVVVVIIFVVVHIGVSYGQ